ncbi:MAG: manganese efflux pump [Lachnospiraceae bacterium]|nr:manganese efflux pump [Lachnospiraceae bacterium]
MNWIENILIIGGVSLNIFAAMEIEGAMLSRVKKRSLIIAVILVVALQLGFFFGGYALFYHLGIREIFKDAKRVGDVIAAIVFMMLGIRLLIEAAKKKFINETRRELKVSRYIRVIIVAAIYTFAIGCASGLIQSNPWPLFIIIIICSILVVVGGLYTGYHYGFESKTGAYVAGAILLFLAGFDLIFVDVLKLIQV